VPAADRRWSWHLQTTLLAAAIGIILALVAALVGPLLIDWGTYRALVEREASRLVGVEVRVDGEIDARLLPSPELTLHKIEIGPDGAEAIRADSLDIQLALGSLMRGEWRATEMRLTGPQLRLGLDASGHVKAPDVAIGFKPDVLTIDRLSVVDGKVTLAYAGNGASVTLEKLYFNGDAQSLLGPFHGEGDVVVAGEHYPYRITTGRTGDDGTLKIKLNVDPRSHPLNFETEGTLAFAGSAPRYDGTLSLVRPAAIRGQGRGPLQQPWHLRGKVKVTAASALMQNAEFLYGSEEHGLKLTGVADFKFGKSPRFDGVISGNQIDVDRALGAGGDGRPLPGTAVRKLAELAAQAVQPGIPVRIGIGIDQVTLAGNVVRNVRGDITADGSGWNLQSFEFRAPGFTQARLSGHLAVADSGVTFTGPAEIESNDPKALAAWLEGRPAPKQADLRPLRLRGDVTLGTEKVAVEHLAAEFAGKTVAGSFGYRFAAEGRPSKLDAALNAPALDLDAVLGFGKALLAGSSLERPHEMAITADIGEAVIAGLTGHGISARVKVDADHWQIDRLTVADLGGAAFSASGRIVLTGASPQGTMRVDLDAPEAAPVMALLARFAPSAAKALEGSASAMAPADLHAELTLDGRDRAGDAKLGIDGTLGKVRMALAGQGEVDPKAWRIGSIRLDGKLSADDGRALVSLLGLDRLVAVGAGPGAFTLAARGTARGTWHVDSRLAAEGLDATARGTAQPFADSRSAKLRVTVVHANAAPLRGANGGPAALPAFFSTNLALTGTELTLGDIKGNVAGTGLRGKIGVSLDAPHRLQGRLEADNVDGAGLLAAAIGMPAPEGDHGKEPGWAWPDEPFGGGIFGDLAGDVSLKLGQVALLPRLTAREFRTTLHFGKNEFALEKMAGTLSGGQFSGALSFRSGNDGLTAHATITLAGANATSLLHAPARPPVTGALGLTTELEGAGLSPVALVGSLRGSGKITLTDAELAALDPRAFDAVTRAVDQGLTVEPDRISDMVGKALDSGQLSIRRMEGSFVVNAGQMRFNDVTAESSEAALSLGGHLDLTDGSLEAHLVLSGASKSGVTRPDIFMSLNGPMTSPSRNIDVSALTGWLTLRQIENQARRVRELEEAARKEREAEQKRREAERQRQEELERKRQEAEQKRQEEVARKQQEAEQRRQEAELKRQAAEQKRKETAQKALSRNVRAVAPPLVLTPVPSTRFPPIMPAPVDVSPLPPLGGAVAPEASVDPQSR
jgi:large subunit ribosomal protein L24